MPERKGRKRRPRERDRRREHVPVSGQEEPAPPRAQPRAQPGGGPLPSTTARATGFMIAIVTAFIAVIMVREALSGDHSGVDAAARIVAGALLIALAVVVGVLVLFPAQIRDRLRRRG